MESPTRTRATHLGTFPNARPTGTRISLGLIDGMVLHRIRGASSCSSEDIYGRWPSADVGGPVDCRSEYSNVRVRGVRLRCSARISRVAAYTVNEVAVRHAKRLIDARQYVLRSRWQNVQPRAREQNAYLKTHSWDEYAAWHLGLTEGAPDEVKARYAFVYGDFRRLHRMGLIACHYRAAEWGHKEIELAAHELLQYLDQGTA
jgi:hypothetical protein